MSVVINNILTYIQSARDSDTVTDIQHTVENFYKSKDIQKAKQELFDTIQEKATFRHQVKKDIQDILDAFDTANAKQLLLPTYAAIGKNALPPSNGYEFLKETMDNVSEDISRMKSEIASLKSEKRDSFHDEFLKSIAEFKEQMKQEFSKQIAQLRNEFMIMNNATQPKKPDDRQNSTQENVSQIVADKIAQSRSKTTKDYQLRYRSPTPQERPSPNFAAALKRAPNAVNLGQEFQPRTSQYQGPPIVPKPRARKPVIRGTKSVIGKPFGAVRYADIYIGGCYKNVTVGDIEGYCRDNLNVKFEKCIALETKSTRFNSFKLTLEFEDRNKLLNGDLWPKNVVVRKFTQPRVALSNDVGAISQKQNDNVS